MGPWEKLLTNLANLFKVKTVVTLAIVFTFCFLTIKEITISSEFMMIAAAIVTYFFAKPENEETAANNGDNRGRKKRYETKKNNMP